MRTRRYKFFRFFFFLFLIVSPCASSLSVTSAHFPPRLSCTFANIGHMCLGDQSTARGNLAIRLHFYKSRHACHAARFSCVRRHLRWLFTLLVVWSSRRSSVITWFIGAGGKKNRGGKCGIITHGMRCQIWLLFSSKELSSSSYHLLFWTPASSCTVCLFTYWEICHMDFLIACIQIDASLECLPKHQVWN